MRDIDMLEEILKGVNEAIETNQIIKFEYIASPEGNRLIIDFMKREGK